VIKVEVAWAGIGDVVAGLAAVAKTFERTGVGVSYYGTRPPLPSDKGRPARAQLILGAIRVRRGADPLDPPADLEREMLALLGEEVEDAMMDAYRTEHPQRDRIKKALLGGAKELREDAQDRIKNNSTGFKNSGKYAKRKAMFLNMPASQRAPQFMDATNRFGGSRPLVLTGRLYDSMRERWYEIQPRQSRISMAGIDMSR